MNLGQLRTAVDRRTGIAVDTTTQTEWINFVLDEIALERNWWWLDKSSTVSVTAGTATYALPADVRGIYSVVDSDGYLYDEASTRDLVIYDRQDEVVVSFGTGRFYSMDGANIRLAPTPGSATTLTVRYWGGEPDLVADGDTPLLPSPYHQAVVELVSLLVMQRRGSRIDSAKAEGYADMFKTLIRKMNGQALRRQGVSRVPRIRPGSGW